LKKLTVNLEASSYPVFIGTNFLNKISARIKEYFPQTKILIICDKNVYRFHHELINNAFRRFKDYVFYYYLKPGEKSKSFKELNKIYHILVEHEFDRSSLIVALGGGVAGDISSFVASTYMRGIYLVHIPTTLLSMVDSSIGGKTAINFESRKNLVGSFYQPEFVFIDTNFLLTLPPREISSGMGEIIKYAFISNHNFNAFLNKYFADLREIDTETIEKIIAKAVSVKAAVVSRDEREDGLRKILNFGHTFAHAYESASGMKIKHGEAVVLGIISALVLSNKLKILSDKRFNEFLALPLKMKLKNKMKDVPEKNVLEFMRNDKKVRKSKINFVLISRIGKILLDVEAAKGAVLYSIRKTKELTTH
jgi:3-dehydroquinate synthase